MSPKRLSSDEQAFRDAVVTQALQRAFDEWQAKSGTGGGVQMKWYEAVVGASILTAMTWMFFAGLVLCVKATVDPDWSDGILGLFFMSVGGGTIAWAVDRAEKRG